jgi:hypothetical protein
MREVKFWKYKETLILKTEISESTDNKMVFGNNGMLSTLMNGRENQVKVN